MIPLINYFEVSFIKSDIVLHNGIGLLTVFLCSNMTEKNRVNAYARGIVVASFATYH
jgi:hypothetical protein